MINYTTNQTKSQENIINNDIITAENRFPGATESNKAVDLYRKKAILAETRTKNLHKAYMQLYKETNLQYYLKRAESVGNCHDYALFRHYFDPGNTAKLKQLNRCKNPMCTFCQWVEAKKRYTFLSASIAILQQEYKLNHVVITIENCTADVLQSRLNLLHKIITATMRHFKVQGYYRATEITYNKKDKTYHPHCHLLVTDFIPIYELEAFVAEAYKKAIPTYTRDYCICYTKRATNYIKELCKYVTKPTDFDTEELKEMIKYESLHHVRKIACGGVIKNTIKTAKTLLSVHQMAEKTELELYGFTDILHYLK